MIGVMRSGILTQDQDDERVVGLESDGDLGRKNPTEDFPEVVKVAAHRNCKKDKCVRSLEMR